MSTVKDVDRGLTVDEDHKKKADIVDPLPVGSIVGLQAEIIKSIYDNTTGDITPAVLRSLLLDMTHAIEHNTGGSGSVGTVGPEGPQGLQGVIGPEGAQGLQGIIGSAGAQGLQGIVGSAGADGHDGTDGIDGTDGTSAGFQLDSNHKIPAQFLPLSSDTPHHVFATQADMLAGGATIHEGEMVLVHGDPVTDNNGEYMALQDAPTILAHYDHLGEHVAIHRHDGADIDVVEPFKAGTVHLQDLLNGPYTPTGLADHAMSAGDLRHLIIGKTYNFPTEDFETFPGSGVMMQIAKTSIIGVPKTNHHYVNACLIRTGVHTWIAEAEEHTGTNRQPTVVWSLDLDPAWSDHSGIGDIGARSFTSVTTSIIDEIGDATQLGADTLVARLLHEETERHTLSTRIATLEGGIAQQHVDVIQDFKLQVNNQGPHYCIVNDRPANPDHIGIDLFNGTEHKVLLEYATGFDPADFIDGGIHINWLVGPKPNVWLQKGSEFKQLVDPLSSAVLGFTAIKSFIENGSILTVKWDLTNTRLLVIKVQAPSIHVVTNPDHQPLQVGGQVDAKSLPFVSLNSEQLTHVKANSLWIDEHQQLMWKDNSGAENAVINAGVHAYSVVITPLGGATEADINAMDFSGYAPQTVGTALAIDTHHVVTFYDGDGVYYWRGPKGVTVGLGGNHTVVAADLQQSGTDDHSAMSNRDAADAHPRSSITDVDKVFTDRFLGLLADGTVDSFGNSPYANIDAVERNSEYYVHIGVAGTFPPDWVSGGAGFLVTRMISGGYQMLMGASGGNEDKIWYRKHDTIAAHDVWRALARPVVELSVIVQPDWDAAAVFITKTIDNLVTIRGLAKGSKVPSTVCKLPVGYKPRATMYYIVATNSGFGKAHITPLGDVVIFEASAAVTWVDLSTITFQAA